MDRKSVLFIVVLVVLLLIAVVQAVQINGIKDRISGGSSSSSAYSTQSPVSSGAVSAPSNVQSLPQMVGGC
ncbi:MAG TPA: hypothetical protein VJC00_04420 [Candidatus Nanoarchaeia archaeon]|nr:hypothetical protein [Candidatus Nanoarchaeia archaeon]